MDLFEKLDGIRRKILLFSFYSLMLLFLGFGALAIHDAGALRTVLVIVSFAFLLINLSMISFFVSSYKQLYNQNMMKNVMSSVFEDVTYEPKSGLPQAIIENTDMIRLGNRYESSEYRTGTYRGIRFKMANVTLKNMLNEGKRSASVTYFSGSWMVLSFPRAFKSYLQVKEKSFLNAQKPRGSHPELDRVAVGSEDFCRFFKAYAESEKEAEAFLSKPLCDAILAVNYELRGDLMFFFANDQLHIALHGVRAKYEPPMLGKLYRDEVEKALMADCRAITAFLDRLIEIESLFKKDDTTLES